jgi:hypothetical protein
MLTLGVQSITSTSTLKGDLNLTSKAYLAAIDSTVTQLWLPNDVCDQFVQAFDLKYDKDTDLFLVDESTRQNLQKLNPQLSFRLGNNLGDFKSEDTVTIVLPYAAFDLQASYPLYDKPTSYFPIRRALNTDTYTLGRAFLQEAYLIVDYGKESFSVNQAVYSDPVPDPDIVAIRPGIFSSGGNNSSVDAGDRNLD